MNISEAAPCRILIVDDEEILLSVMTTILDKADDAFHVTTTLHPATAKKFLEDSTFEILITDLTMPGMTGYELADIARFLNPRIKILGVSGYAVPDDAAEHFDTFLGKPFAITDFLRVISKLRSDPSPPPNPTP